MRLFAAVVNMSITASFIIGAVLLARLALRRAPKIFSYALWWAVLLRLLCPVSLPLPDFALPEAPAVSAEKITETSPKEGSIPSQSSLPLSQPDLSEPQDIPHSTEAIPLSRNPFQDLLPLASRLWLWGAAAMLLLGIVSYLRFRLHLRGSVRAGGNVYLADHLDTAFVAGLFFPKIYLPSDLPLEQIRYILAHERHHIARLDHVVKHIFYFALCLHWFNPLVWIAFILMGKDMEMSCDEAVVRKLGSHIRADYSASLLHLAAARRIVCGSPLCFGEGDTKGRIRNLARWKPPKKGQSILCLTLCALILTACAASPTRETVGLSPAPTEGDPVLYQDTFQNTDGTVVFHMELALPSQSICMVEAVPRPITSQDMERVARVLLGNVDFYEREPSSNPQYGKQQYAQMLSRWEPYVSGDPITPEPGELLSEEQGLNIDFYTAKQALETAPEGNPLTPCDWTLKKERVYNDCAWEIYGRPIEEDGDWLVATAEKDGLGYTYMVIVDNQDGIQLNRYLFQIGGASLNPSFDRKIAWEALCRTGEPTQQQIQAVQDKVMDMLKRMDFGQWAITDTQLEHMGNGELMLQVRAIPVIQGVPVVPGSGNLPETYLTPQARFLMSANGDVIDMKLDTPLDVKQADWEASALPLDQLMDIAQQHLKSSEAQNYGLQDWSLAALEERHQEAILCHVEIQQLQNSMVKVQENSDTYVPALTLQGHAEYRGKDSGTVYYSSGGSDFFMAISALDGSILF